MPTYSEQINAVAREILNKPTAEIEELVSRAHSVLLKRLVDESGAQLSIEDSLTLQELAFELDLAVTGSMELDPQLRQDAAYLAALIFEVLGDLSALPAGDDLPAVLRHSPASLFLRSAILYSVGAFEANSSVVGRRLLARLEPLVASALVSKAAEIQVGAYAVLSLVAFLGRRFDELRRQVAAGLLALVAYRNADEQHAPDLSDELKMAGVLFGIADSCRNIADFMVFGREEMYELGFGTLTELQKWCLSSGEAYLYWVVSRLILVAEGMKHRSVHNLLRDRLLPAEYVPLLASDGITELWTSQNAAIEAGLLNARSSAIVSLPTGAGKTLVAELFILRCLSETPSAWGLYIVPTRALIAEVERTLRARLSRLNFRVRSFIAGGEVEIFLEQETISLSRPGTVTILTPEKADLFLRVRQEATAQCGFCIVDEAHRIGERQRGPLVDNLVTRLKILQPNVRVLLISPFIANLAQVSPWLGDNVATCRSLWQPTRQLRGLARLYGPLTPTGRGGFTVDGGVALIRNARDFEGRIVLRHLFQAKFNRRRKLSSSITEHAAQIVRRWIRAPGTLIAFFERPASAEKCARDVAEDYEPIVMPDDRRRELVEQIGRAVGGEHELVEMTAKGVAYHHGRLPRVLRSAIERGFRTGALKFVAATATLAEGVNTPATTVIIAGTNRFDERTERAAPLDVRDFLNMAGRAGRPLRDTEGQIILVPSRLAQPTVAMRQAVGYFFPDEDEFELRSAFEEVEAALEAFEQQDAPVPREYQTLLLALVTADLTSLDEVERFFQNTLSAQQTRHDLDAASRGAVRFLVQRGERWSAEDYRVIASTGFSADSGEILYDEVVRLLRESPTLFQEVVTSGDEGRDWLATVLQALSLIPELRTGDFRPDSEFPHADILTRWMEFGEYQDLAGNREFSGSVEKAVDYIGKHVDRLSWGVGAIYLIASHLAERFGVEVDLEFGAVPLYLRFGVNSKPAALLCLMGLSDRIAARILSENYDLEHTTSGVTVESLSAWVNQLDEATLQRLFVGELAVHLADVVATFGVGATGRTRDRVRFEVSLRSGTESLFQVGTLVIAAWVRPGRALAIYNPIEGGRIRLNNRHTRAVASITRRYDVTLTGTVISTKPGAALVEIHN